METLGIEYICSANVARSAMAKVIGRNYVQERGLEEKIKIYSSGVIASDSDALKLPLDMLIDDIKAALHNGIFDEKTRAIAEKIFANEERVRNKMDAENYRNIEHCEKYIIMDGDTKRNIVLLERGLVPWGRFHQQTEIRCDIQLILPMTQKLAVNVRDIYQESGNSPHIIPILEYIRYNDDIEDTIGGTIDMFRSTCDYLMKIVPQSILKAIKEFNIQ